VSALSELGKLKGKGLGAEARDTKAAMVFLGPWLVGLVAITLGPMLISLYLYQKGFGQFDMGYASAMAWVLLLIIGAFTAINFYASKFWVFYDD
jgi:hypothetical protein